MGLTLRLLLEEKQSNYVFFLDSFIKGVEETQDVKIGDITV